CDLPLTRIGDITSDIDTEKKSFKPKDKVIYTCSPGFFMDYNDTLTEHTITCLGQLGDWWPLDWFTCKDKPVCEEPDEVDPPMVAEKSKRHLYLNGTMTYLCPPGMGWDDTDTSGDEASPQVRTCSQEDDEYLFKPESTEIK
ncbi:unnamed protein product, partial [Meganyctiphanes norvegica]